MISFFRRCLCQFCRCATVIWSHSLGVVVPPWAPWLGAPTPLPSRSILFLRFCSLLQWRRCVLVMLGGLSPPPSSAPSRSISSAAPPPSDRRGFSEFSSTSTSRQALVVHRCPHPQHHPDPSPPLHHHHPRRHHHQSLALFQLPLWPLAIFSHFSSSFRPTPNRHD